MNTKIERHGVKQAELRQSVKAMLVECIKVNLKLLDITRLVEKTFGHLDNIDGLWKDGEK